MAAHTTLLGCMHLTVFTDLDGSLLEHGDYSFEASRIPLIFATSKTRPEVEHLQARIGIQEPFIVENGAAVYFPDAYRGFCIGVGIRQPPYRVIRAE